MGISPPLRPNRSLAFYLGVFAAAVGVIGILFRSSLEGVLLIVVGGAIIALSVWWGRIEE
ncbi:MAG: hypothetical protein ACLQD9_01780 [Thermoplasmata archaeon]